MIEKVLKSMIDYFGTDVHRINHALKDYGFAMTICRDASLNEHDVEIVEIAAVLHDIGFPVPEQKYGSCIGTYQEPEDPPIALNILEKLGIEYGSFITVQENIHAMDIQARKILFVQEFLKLQNEEIVSGLEDLLRKKKAEQYKKILKPMSRKQLHVEIDQALDES